MSLCCQYHETLREVGCDEAGRGCLAGPVVAAAVILSANNVHPLINDSKKITEKSREELAKWIYKNALAVGVGIVQPKEIDRINILQASIKAMHKAIDKLDERPEHILVDGNKFNSYKKVPHLCVIKGDGKYANIAAASIIAKYERDVIMKKLHKKHPSFDWETNKGYPTLHHRKTLINEGPTKYHRASFKVKRTAPLDLFMGLNK